MNNTIVNSKKLGYFRVAGATPEIKVADVDFNLKEHLQLIRLAEQEQIDLLVFPDFSLTGVTCQDLFKQDILLEKTKSALEKIKVALAESNGFNLNIIMTIPEKINGKLVKVLYFLNHNTTIRILVPVEKSASLRKFFASQDELITEPTGEYFLMKSESVLFLKNKISDINFSLGIYQSIADLYKNHANKILTPNINVVMSSSHELIENQTETEKYLSSFAQLSQTGLIYLSPGYGESTTDHIYSGRGYIFEQDRLLAATTLYEPDLMIGDLDLQIVVNSTSSTSQSFNYCDKTSSNLTYGKSPTCLTGKPIICLELNAVSKPLRPLKSNQNFKSRKNSLNSESAVGREKNRELYRKFSENPFLPEDSKQHKSYFDSVLNMAAQGLRKRLEHLNNPQIILGLSGGLDSTLALLIAVRTQKILKKSNQYILCVSMPGFGTTDRTYNNTKNLADACNTNYLEIPITAAVKQHFKDINHDPNLHDVTYENAQARERTQILMDLANQRGGIVLGTGDLSESALGFVTYAGDHISMYHINGGIPKTLIRHLIEFEAKKFMAENLNSKQEKQSENLAKILFDILATPISPELLPPEQGQIAQQTEHLIGPYELHDLFLYYFMRYQFTPRKILFIAEQTFGNKYDRITIIKWLKLFYKRLFANQFKRSAAPDGPIISQIALSPRQGFIMPSDAVAKLWIEDLEKIE
ncbi:MAG TPA: NAD(+) synthase [Clostridiaceae bacterium]|nr:NAD(+) synthase [Clostridiaceae bacterium]